MRAMMLLLVAAILCGCGGADRKDGRPVPEKCMEYAGCDMQQDRD
ncbi:MAG: hypothetical protein VYB54_02505 [Pseudomonadota bacterium]|nr:hypothetical protein [Pseudomonadota bacterium]